MSCLVVLELENGKPNRPSLATVSAAKRLSENIDVLILDGKAKEDVAILTDAKNVYYFSSNQQDVLAEEIVDILKPLCSKYKFLLSPSGTIKATKMSTGLLSIASKLIAVSLTNISARGSCTPLIRPWGIAIPRPIPVLPSFSLAVNALRISCCVK